MRMDWVSSSGILLPHEKATPDRRPVALTKLDRFLRTIGIDVT
jgi:hypothetical protein